MTTGRDQWAVVGGGMMGMTIAWRLAQAGKRVVLFEASGELGGLAAPWQLGDVTWDRHYHVTLLSDMHTRKVMADLGLESEMNWVVTKTGFMTKGRLVSMSNSLEYLGLPGLSLVDKFRVAGTIVYGSKVHDWRRLEETPVEDWLVSLSGRSGFDRLWRPLLQAKLGDGWRESSAAFIWATIQRLYAARSSGLKQEMFGYVPGGYARIVKTFHEQLLRDGVQIRLRQPVQRVTGAGRAGDGANGHVGPIKVQTPAGEEEFARVVFTTTPRRVAACCPELSDDERAKFQDVPYQGVVCASILVEKELAGYYLTYLTDDWVPFTAVVEMSAFVDPAEFGGRTLLYLPKYAPGDDPIFSDDDDTIQARFLGAMRDMYPKFADNRVLAFRVSRVKEVFPLPRLGYSKRLPPTTTSIPGVVAVSSAQIVNGTLNVNDTLNVAERAARSILVQDGRRLFLD